MTTFAWRAVDPAGKRVRGTDAADNPARLAGLLERRGLLLLAADHADDAGKAGWRVHGFGRAQAVLEVTRALAALLPAGLSLARALTAAEQLADRHMRPVLETVRARVERGGSVADALAQHPHVFSALYVGVVRAGERSGDLDAAFRRLADQLEREDRLKGRLLSAAIYPLILLVLGGLAVLVLLLFVIPRFADLLEGAGAGLPASTTALLALATAVRQGWMFIPILLGALAAAAVATWRTPAGRQAVARAWLALPMVGRLRREQLAGRTARLLSVLLGGGAPLLGALDDAAQTVGDPAAADDLTRIRGRVREGASLTIALGESPLYPPLLNQLVSVGEESGQLESFLGKAADLFEERTERAVQRLVTLIEPAVIVGFGAVVGFIALSLFQAIYGVNAGSFR